MVERDDEAVLTWAREPWACIIFNLHTPHDQAGLASSAEAFGMLIDLARTHGGSYYLTYHVSPRSSSSRPAIRGSASS